MNHCTRKTTADRRGRIFVDGFFIDFESEEETFLRLAEKYLIGEIEQVSLLSHSPQIRFRTKALAPGFNSVAAE